MQATKRL